LRDQECFIFLGDGQIELRRVVVGVVGEHLKKTVEPPLSRSLASLVASSTDAG
jgi:hypothetical protein